MDCNPLVFWFNETMLSDAGVKNPVEQHDAGTWNRDALQELLTKIKGTGKRGLAIAAEWAYWLSWMTTFGGKTFDENNKAIFDADPKSMETLNWIWAGFKDETITYGGSLPKGQGIDALFYAGQLATCPDGSLDPAQPEEAEDRLRHRPVPVRGRQDDRCPSTSRWRPWV